MFDGVMGGALRGAVIGACVGLAILVVWKCFGGGISQPR